MVALKYFDAYYNPYVSVLLWPLASFSILVITTASLSLSQMLEKLSEQVHPF